MIDIITFYYCTLSLCEQPWLGGALYVLAFGRCMCCPTSEKIKSLTLQFLLTFNPTK